jgi:hypothetical protein
MLFLVFAALLSAQACTAQFMDVNQLQYQQCVSYDSQYATRVLISSMPSSPVDLLVMTKPMEKIEIRCFQVFKNGPVVAPALQHLCSTPTQYLLCSSPVLADVYDRNWTCSDITSIYEDVPRTVSTFGAVKGPSLWFKLQWSNLQLGSACFPLYLTTQAVILQIAAVQSTVATTIAFAIIGGIVLVLVVVFGGYQLRKLRAKFGAKRHALNKPPTTAAFRPSPDKQGQANDQQAVQGVDLYGEHAIAAPGVQKTQLPDEGLVLESKPLVKPWYERESFRMPAAGLFQHEQSPAPDPNRALRHRRGGLSPEQIDVSLGGPHARGASPMVGPAAPEEMVVVCTDCFRAIQDSQTPQFCTVTGMRHY